MRILQRKECLQKQNLEQEVGKFQDEAGGVEDSADGKPWIRVSSRPGKGEGDRVRDRVLELKM